MRSSNFLIATSLSASKSSNSNVMRRNYALQTRKSTPPQESTNENHRSPHPRRAMERQDRPAAAALLHQPDGRDLADALAGDDGHVHVSRLAHPRSVH